MAMEAAYNLAHLGQERARGSDGPKPDKPNPAIAKFSQPTVAEAILAALDRDLKAHDAQPKKDARDSFRQGKRQLRFRRRDRHDGLRFRQQSEKFTREE